MTCANAKWLDKAGKEVVVKGESHEKTAELARLNKGVMVDAHTGEILLDFREIISAKPLSAAGSVEGDGA